MPDFAAFSLTLKQYQQTRDLYPWPPAGPPHPRWPKHCLIGHFLSIERRPADCSWSSDLVHACCTALLLYMYVWRRVAGNVRERHGHELMCARLAQAGQTWFEVTVEGLIAEGIPEQGSEEC
jgi:hypothetical protein